MDSCAKLRDGRRIESDPKSWEAYEKLVFTVLNSANACRIVLVGPCTPRELANRISFDRVFLLDCDPSERRARLLKRNKAADNIDEALARRC